MPSVSLKIKVIPGAKKSELVGWLGDELKIRINTQPEKGRANKRVISLLASTLGLPAKNISITGGQTSQHKTIQFDQLDQHGLDQILTKLVGSRG